MRWLLAMRSFILFDALGSLASHCAAAFVDHSSRGCLCVGCARHEASLGMGLNHRRMGGLPIGRYLALFVLAQR
jgi:hypothetical protein